MASLNMFISPAASPAISKVNSRRSRVQTISYATASKGSAGASEEKSLLDFILGAVVKTDTLLEVDPVLAKVEGKKGTTSGKKNSVAPPPKKEEGGGGFGGLGGLGGLFAKK